MGEFYNNDNSGNFGHQTPNFGEQFAGSSIYTPRNSRLEPTAQEFYPASYNSYESSHSENRPRKPQQQGNKWNGRNQRYGSGRLANSNVLQNSFDYQQFESTNSKEDDGNETQTGLSNSMSFKNSKQNFDEISSHTGTSEPSSSQSTQNSRKFKPDNKKNGFYSKAYSKNRYENRAQENKNNATSQKRNDFYRGGNTKNFDEMQNENFSQESSSQESTLNRNRTYENNSSSFNQNYGSRSKGKSNYASNSRNLVNELRDEVTNENLESYGRNRQYDNNKYKNTRDEATSENSESYGRSRPYKNTNKSRNNFYGEENLDTEKSYESNFDYDTFPSSMRYQGNNSKSGRFKSNKFNSGSTSRNFHENLYKNRDETTYKSRDITRGKYRENNDEWNSHSNNYDDYAGRSSNSRSDNGRAFGNWRNKPKYISEKKDKKTNAAGQRERLIDMIDRRTLECLVCCEKIKTNDKVWSCIQCYHIMHLNCISAWAKSSKVEENWRCPACQNICSELPSQYRCYCGKVTDPKFDPNVIAHGCGEMCLRKGRNCEHKCTILCHPGPCPDCNIMVSKPCGCGKTSQTVKCSTELEIVCEAICNKTLECGIHECTEKCHIGPCASCSEVIKQECFCGKTGRKVPCTSEYSGQTDFCCENPCQKLLSCLNHKCEKHCHPGDCGPCSRDVNIINTCFCGKIPLKEERTSCLDPIPCCEKICGKILPCGQPSNPHVCQEKCHEGKCPPCPLTTVVRCRCGHMDKEMACQKLTTKADDARCEKKCNKKRLCGKHKCNQRCCIEVEHFCPLPCNHMLSCGLHRCERTCHSGRCPPCLESSFEELHCECGASVIYPPVPCGTKPPSCSQPCSRERACGHPPNHECHTGPCPSCFVLTKRWCYGHHEQRAAIPCHQENFSCGLPCGKPMPCGRHKCTKPCHEGDCPTPCTQPCTIPRLLCGHPCGKPCHDPPCPESNCRQMVPISCSCGHQKGSRPCTEVADEFRNIEMAQLKEKMDSMAVPDQAIDISDIVVKPKRPAVLKILECNDECKILERNRRLAIGLQIRNPDLSQKLTPRYSDFMKQWAKKDSHFCQKVHNKLTELVQLAKQSKQKSRSHSFESMNRDKRHFIHEYAEHFGCESAAYDQEPNRNVVVTAMKDKSWLPSFSLLEVIQRENGQRKVPGPIWTSGSSSKSETVSLKLTSRAQKPPIEKVEENVFRNPWAAVKPPADNEENDRYFSNP